jgi:putative DNA primase/helicase
MGFRVIVNQFISHSFMNSESSISQLSTSNEPPLPQISSKVTPALASSPSRTDAGAEEAAQQLPASPSASPLDSAFPEPPAAPLSDGSDDLPAVDPVEESQGPLLFIDADKVKTNLPALAMKYASDEGIAYCAKTSSFYSYEPSPAAWVPRDEEWMVWSASSFLKQVADKKDAIMLLPKRTPSLAKSMLKFVKGCSPMGTPVTSMQECVAVKNGILLLSGTEPVLRPRVPHDWITSFIPVDYDPAATCPRFLNEVLKPALKDPNDISLLQRDSGRTLVPGNKAQRFSIVVGGGGSGKSLVITVFEELIWKGRFAHLRTNHLSTRFETHGFQGKDVLVAKDVPSDFLSNSGAAMIKSLTGADHFQTEKKYGGKFEMRGDFYVNVTSNTRLPIAIQDDEQAWRRRILVYVFDRKAPDRVIPNFADILVEEEGEGILNWLAEGYMVHRAELQDKGDFILTDEQRQRIEDVILESKGHTEFVRTNVVAGDGDLTSDEIYQRYVTECRARGWKPTSRQKFLKELPDLMEEFHDTGKRHDIMRAESARKGFKRVQFAAAA